MEIIKRIINFIMDILETVTFVGSIFIVVYLFIMQPHQVKGHSMDTTFANGDYIITSKISYRLNPPKKGDVVVFKSPSNPDIDYIKRIIAVAGDTIKISGSDVYVNKIKINEPYIHSKTRTFENGFLKENQEITVPDGHIFVMGDNRERSSDSREFGFVPLNDVIGKVIFRYYPFNAIGPIKSQFDKRLQSFVYKKQKFYFFYYYRLYS